MGNTTTRLAVAAGAAGTILIAAAQTKPEDALSNVAGWLHVLGVDHVPASLASSSADSWATVAGITVAILSFLTWVLTKTGYKDRLLGTSVEAPQSAQSRRAEGDPRSDDTLLQLVARREAAQRIVDNVDVDRIAVTLEGYRNLIRQASENERPKPERVSRGLEIFVPQIWQEFERVRKYCEVPPFEKRLRPLDDEDSAGSPPIYRPEKNWKFLDSHKSTLVDFESALNELSTLVTAKEREVGRLNAAIQAEGANFL